MLAAAAMAAHAGTADRPTSARALTVAIVNLAEIPDLAPRPPPESRRPAWRTTFGSERVTEPEIKPSGGESLAPLAGADVVLIQGVQVAARLRRLFPPRAWRLVVSRRILSATDPVGFRTVRSNRPPTTAIAIRARPDLRITARAFTLALDGPGATQSADESEAAATAVRLVDLGGRNIWLASVALPASCGTGDPPCPALKALEAWRRERLDAGEPALVGGRIGAGPPADPAPPPSDAPVPCASHTIESDLPWHRQPDPPDMISPESRKSCISIVRLEG